MAVLMDNRFVNNITDVKYILSGVLIVTLKMKMKHPHIISVFLPKDNKSKQEREEFYQKFDDEINQITDYNMVIYWKTRIDNGIVDGVKQRFNEPVLNRNGKLLIQTYANNNLRICNTYFDLDP